MITDGFFSLSTVNKLTTSIISSNGVSLESLSTNMITGANMNALSSNLNSSIVSNLSAESINATLTTINNLQAQSVSASTGVLINNLICTGLYVNDTIGQNLFVNNFDIAELVVSRINIQAANLTGISSDNLTSVDTSAALSDVNQIDANDVNVTQTGAAVAFTGGTISTTNFTYNDTNQENLYTSPSEGVFRGICFFSDLDFGLGTTNTKVSLNMKTENRQPYVRGYNKYLNAMDIGNQFDGTKAILSLCTDSTPPKTLRWQDDGNLAIYSDGTKIWQNGSMVSDKTLKTNIQPISAPMSKINKIDGVMFDYKSPLSGTSMGVILEQVEEIFPECIVSGQLVHLEKLVPLLVEGIKELKLRNDEIRSRIGVS